MAVPLHCTAIGKAVLAALPEPEVRTLLARTGAVARTPTTLTDLDGIVAHLADVRDRGWSVDEQENEAGVRCVGAAVIDHTRRVVGGISVSQLVSDPDGRPPEAIGPSVAAAAADISRSLGGRA
jgi:DNA-binding IclR family transcriptional regulator